MPLPTNLQLRDQNDRDAAFLATLVSLRIMAKNNRINATEAHDLIVKLIGEEDLNLRARTMWIVDWIDGRKEA